MADLGSRLSSLNSSTLSLAQTSSQSSVSLLVRLLTDTLETGHAEAELD